MKIGYLVPFGSNPMAELETKIRFKYCVEKLGHKFIELNMDGFDLDTGIHAEDIGVDFVFSHDTAVCAEKPLPDAFSLFSHWSPNGFLISADFTRYFTWMSKYDMVIGGYESEAIQQDVSNHPDVYPNFYNITSSISKDFAIPPKKHKNLKLFYVGINLEKIQRGNTRYIKLLKYLDKIDLISIYGPNETLGVKNLWEGFNNYKGEIPFDGHSIIEKINESGIALALNSPIHSYCGTVSNRIYEAAAGGAVIISDENEYVRNYFGDSVFYIDIQQDENKQIEDIKDILNFIRKNPDKAYQMAKTAQNIFLEKLSLDQQVEGLFDFVKKEKKVYRSTDTDNVDIICFVSSYADFQKAMKELKRQYHRNLNIFVLSDKKCTQELRNSNVKNNVRIIENSYKSYGEAFYNICHLLKSKYFMFYDSHTSMHANHIKKLLRASKKSNRLFSYTGIYLKYLNKDGTVEHYDPYSTVPLLDEELCSFLRLSSTDENVMFNIEERFSLSCCMFKREILELVDQNEVTQVKKAIHFYLACASIIKKNLSGHFVYAISCGYVLDKDMTIQDIFKEDRKFNYIYRKSEKTYFKDLYLIFFKYDYVVPPVPWGFNYEFPQRNNRHPIIHFIKKLIPRRVKDCIKRLIFA